MNVADSQRLESAFEKLGLESTSRAADADVIVLNTCVVRQSAEDKAYGYLQSLRPIKDKRPETVIGLMGCLVGIKTNGKLKERFPWVDVFAPPSDPAPVVDFLRQRDGLAIERAELAERFDAQDNEIVLPLHQRGKLVAAHVPVVLGCSHACTFCIIPFRRGVEHSRSVDEIMTEARSLVAQGVKEITLLGQIVDRYGYDLKSQTPALAASASAGASISNIKFQSGTPLVDVLRLLNDVEGLERIRFLTSHPNWMTDELLEAVAELPKVCEHIEVPVQAGHDEVLERMKRGYTADDYRRLVERIRRKLPNGSIATDIIVGFPGETDAQFQATYELLAELKLDVAHIAKYSVRPQTVAQRTMVDDVPPEEKERRRKAIEDLQERVVGEINARFLNQMIEVLVEGEHKSKWRGRTRTNKLVFFEDKRPQPEEWRGKLANVHITWTGPWSMQGVIAADTPTASG
jgi:tRNA-2-methylthio-N6-dimethylallyladenosine synthase